VKKAFRTAEDRMISGKRRRRLARPGETEKTLTVGGTSYVWSYRHGWQIFGKDLKAISVSVCLDPGRTRELILDFTFEVAPPDTGPSEARMAEAIADGIAAAREAGWDPESRGRAFRHEVETLR
jgi:hypothetical protein